MAPKPAHSPQGEAAAAQSRAGQSPPQPAGGAVPDVPRGTTGPWGCQGSISCSISCRTVGNLSVTLDVSFLPPPPIFILFF